MQIYSTLTPFELAFLFLFLDDGVMMLPKRQNIVPLFFKTIVIVSIILFTKTELFLGADSALQAATILVAMASEKKKWRLNYRRKSPFGDQRI